MTSLFSPEDIQAIKMVANCTEDALDFFLIFFPKEGYCCELDLMV